MDDDLLQAAVRLFRDLGWHKASFEQAPTLPLGTPEQRKVALAGLRSGDWGAFEHASVADQLTFTGLNQFGSVSWSSWVGPNEAMLSLFAIRVGVDARRARSLLRHCGRVSDEVIAQVLTERGPTFAARVISRPMWRPRLVAVLVADLALPIPQEAALLEEWMQWAERTAWVGRAVDGRRKEELVALRFDEWIEAAVTAGWAPTVALAHAVQHGWVERDWAQQLAFRGLDAARRPSDRRAWLSLLLNQLALSEADIVARADALVPLLAMGEAVLVERLAPVLIAGVDDDALIEVAVSSLTAPTKKAKLLVLKALAARSAPGQQVREAVVDQVGALAAGRDAAVAKAAGAVMSAWRLAELADPTGQVDASVSGWWQPTPPVWTLPRYERGEVSAQALTELAAVVLTRDVGEADLLTERFFAVANALARDDRDAVQSVLRGITGWPWVTWITDWRNGVRTSDLHDGSHNFLAGRGQAVMLQLGALPCVLSEPSFADLSIDPGDLLARLQAYAEAGVSAQSYDLFLALTRCDVRLATARMGAAFRQLEVAVRRTDGKKLARSAGALVEDYLRDPVGESSLSCGPRTGVWRVVLPPMPEVFSRFGVKWGAKKNWVGDYTYAVFPSWGDAGLVKMAWGSDASSAAGAVYRQLARRGEPLTPGLAINMLAAPHSCHPRALAEATQAVLEAWQRGLLRPGVADVALLGWRQPPTGLASFTATLLEFAEAGLASVVWPVLDDLLVAALAAPRLLAGAAEVAEAMAVLVPEAVAAVGDGRAEAGVLEVPGVRALAARPGTSKAVVAAREVVAALPAAEPAATPVAAPLDRPFDELWRSAPVAVIEDAVSVRAEWIGSTAAARLLRFELVLPAEPQVRYLVEKGWTYDLTNEGQCQATRHVEGSDPATVWLHWNEGAAAMEVAAYRNWRKGGDGALGSPTPLSSSLLTVAVGLAAQDGDHAWAGRSVISDLVDNKRLGAPGVAVAMRTLLASPAVSPARLAGVITKCPYLLGTLWPILTESVRFAGASAESLPRWLSIVLDVALRYAPYLREAAARGLLGEASAWPGLAEIAARPGKSATVAKAARLQRALTE